MKVKLILGRDFLNLFFHKAGIIIVCRGAVQEGFAEVACSLRGKEQRIAEQILHHVEGGSVVASVDKSPKCD